LLILGVLVGVTGTDSARASTPEAGERGGAASERAKPKRPKVTKVKPNSGPLAGGIRVKIKGKNLKTTKKVRFGSKVGTALVVKSDRKIVVTSPARASAGTVPVKVVTKGGKSKKTAKSRFTYATGPGGGPTTPAPTLSTMAPTSGPTEGGTTVTLSGTDLNGATAVRFDGVAATSFSVTSPTQIQAVSPAHAAGAAPVTVSTPAGTSAPVTYTYLEPVADPPTVVAVVPPVGSVAGGHEVTIVGSGFTDATSVTFDGLVVTDVVVDGDNQIVATTPAHAAGPVDVVVTTPAGPGTGASAFTYLPAPAVLTVTPPLGVAAGGTAVTVTGTGFTADAQVLFGGVAATDVVVVSASEITAVTPAHAAGIVDVTVSNAGGAGAGTGLFTYLPDGGGGGGGGGGGETPLPPVVAAVLPLTGPLAGGTAVTISGTGLTGATAVLFGGVPATNVVVVSDTSITATTPAHAAGPVDVTVTTPAGTAVGLGLFVYNPLPGLPRHRLLK
jgi:hypothetical protein